MPEESKNYTRGQYEAFINMFDQSIKSLYGAYEAVSLEKKPTWMSLVNDGLDERLRLMELRDKAPL
jgi:hypothetical protein